MIRCRYREGFEREVLLTPGEVPADQRVGSNVEVSLGLTAAAAVEETSRCLRCDLRSVER